MKRLVLGLALVLLLSVVAVSYAQGPGWWGMGPGMMGGGQGGWYCPYCGQYMGPRGGYGMGPGMMGHGWGMGPGMMGPGYYGQSEECQKFLDETAPLRKELHEKRYEYFEASRNPKSTPESITKLEKEIRELQQKIYSKTPQGCWY